MMNEVAIDWLSYTIKCTDQSDFSMYNIERLQKDLFLDVDVIPTQKNGRYAYSSAIDYSNSITILYNDIAAREFTDAETSLDRYLKMGIHVEISGNGCRMLETHLKQHGMDMRGYILFLKEYGVNFSRIDVAYDDYNRLLDFDVIESKMRNDQVVTRLRNKQQVEGYSKIENLSSSNAKGVTYYFGKRFSDAFIRFYDKKTEQLSKGNPVSDDIETWQRYEVVLKREKANDFVSKYETCEDLSKLYMQVIGGLVRFIDDTDTNKARCKTSLFWERFTNNETPVKLVSKEMNSDLLSVIEWFDKAVANSLIVLLAIAESEGIDFVTELANSGRQLSAKQQNLLNEFALADSERKEKIVSEMNKIFQKK